MHETVAVVGLAVLLTTVVARPWWLPEALVAVPVAGLVVATGAISRHQAWQEVRQLAPVVGFLAAVLVLAAACDGEGLFRTAGQWLSRFARRSSQRLLVGVVALASVITAVLSLDTTVVLLTPVVVVAVRRLAVPPRAPLYATAHLANSASLLLPVSNLTNLLAVAVVPLSFPRFAALMAAPWLVAIAVETVGLRRLFARDLTAVPAGVAVVAQPLPRFATAVVALTVAGFALQPLTGLAPVWVAVAGATVLSIWRLALGRTTPVEVARSSGASFCVFVLALGLVVQAVSDNGLGRVVRDVMPAGVGLLSLLAVAGIAAVLSNLVNNLPATLLLLPVAAAGGVGQVLAVLVGVNIGPNLTYTGSLATLLWRRAVHDVDRVPDGPDFAKLGLLTVPAGVALATVALWGALQVVGG